MTTKARDEAQHSADLEEGCNVTTGRPGRGKEHRIIDAVCEALMVSGYEAGRARRIAEKLVDQLPAIEQGL